MVRRCDMDDSARLIVGAIGTYPVSTLGETLTSATIDRQAAANKSGQSVAQSAVLGLIVGTIDACDTFSASCKLQHASTDTPSAFSDVTGGAVTTITSKTSNSVAPVAIDLGPLKRYLRIVSVVAMTGGVSPTALVSTILMLSGYESLPTF